MDILLFGYGKMGKRIRALAEEAGHNVPVIIDPNYVKGYKDDPVEALKSVDVCIDFSHPDAVHEHIEHTLKAQTPMVIGTTGWDMSGDLHSRFAENGTAIMYGSNYSLGVQLFMKLAAEGAKLFGNSDLFHAMLHELHHTQKVDAPSGTAKTLSKIWRENSSNQKEEQYGIAESGAVDTSKLYVTAQRLGSVFGEHQIRINSDFDDIEITHRARSRDGFAAGSVKAAEWLVSQKPGFYLIEDEITNIVS